MILDEFHCRCRYQEIRCGLNLWRDRSLRAFALKLEIMMLVEHKISEGKEYAQELNSFMFQGSEKGVMLPRIREYRTRMVWCV